MSTQLAFGSECKRNTLDELEALRKAGDVDQLITRALQDDSNCFVLREVLACVLNGSIRSKAHKKLLEAVEPAIKRGVIIPKKDRERLNDEDSDLVVEGVLDRSRSLKDFLLVEDVLPGNGKAEALRVSRDGSMLAYLTNANAPLRDGCPSDISMGSVDTPPEVPMDGGTVFPKMINIIALDPYEHWSLRPNLILPELASAEVELLGLDRAHLYIKYSSGAATRILEIDIRDGALLGIHDLGNHCGALRLDAEGRKAYFVDTTAETLTKIDFASTATQAYPLSLPQGLVASKLTMMEFASNGSMGVILVSPLSEATEHIMAIIRMPSMCGEQNGEFETRWLTRKELWNDFGFDCVRFSCDPTMGHSPGEQGSFYIIDTSSTIHQLSVSTLQDQRLEEIDPARLLSAIPDSKGGRKSSFPILAIGAERPLLASYDMTAGELRLWDISNDELLISIDCPYHIDRLEFLAHDTLLIVKSRSTHTNHCKMAVTFLDALLLAGQAPINLLGECRTLLEPLIAWAPDNEFLGFMTRLIAFNTSYSKEVAP